jgi:hypothetical protein
MKMYGPADGTQKGLSHPNQFTWHIMQLRHNVTWLRKSRVRGRLYSAKLRFGYSPEGRVWTVNRLAKRGIPYNERCVFWNAADEDPAHLFIGCAVINILWNSIMRWAGFTQTVPISNLSLKCWWATGGCSPSDFGQEEAEYFGHTYILVDMAREEWSCFLKYIQIHGSDH